MSTVRLESDLLGRIAAKRFRRSVAFAAAVIVLETTWLLTGLGGKTATHWFSDLIDVFVTAVVGVICLTKPRREPAARRRRGWYWIGAGVLLWGLGEVVWSFYELVLGREVPFPSLADAGFLLLIPFVALGIVSFTSAPRTLPARGRLLLDGLIIGSSLFAVSWLLVLGPVYFKGTGSLLSQILGVAYPFGDIVLLGIVLFAASRARQVERSGFALLGAGIASLAFADSLFTYMTFNKTYTSTDVISSVGWTLGFLLVGLGALRPVRPVSEHVDATTNRLSALFPYVGVPFVALVFSIHLHVSSALDSVEFWAIGVMFTVVSVRQLLMVLENRKLATHLEQRVAERTAEVQTALDELRQASRRQDEFISRASHELFTPLTQAMAAADLVETELPEDGHLHDLIEIVRSGTTQMSHLIDDLLLASGLTGFIACDHKPFDVSRIVQERLDHFQSNGRNVVSDVARHLIGVGDPDRLRTAINHVLSNAEKFSPEGSTITVRTMTDGSTASVVVADEGPGIPRELRSSVFERFFQTDASDTRRYGGLGLGLYLTRQVVMAMGGDVHIDDVDKGCAIRISLPTPGAASQSAA